MIAFFKLTVYTPLYNALIFILDVIPWADVGIALIILTFIVRLVLFPLSKKATRTQIEMKSFEPELNAIKEKYKNEREKQARAVMDFYREKKINPFSGILFVFIQIPIILSLFYIFYSGGLPEINPSLLYSFIKAPENISMEFLGFIDIGSRSLFLALLAGVTQYFQVKFSMPALPPRNSDKPSFKDDLARSMNVQMRYILPVMITFIAYGMQGAVALYWSASNSFTIIQEIYIRRKIAEEKKNV